MKIEDRKKPPTLSNGNIAVILIDVQDSLIAGIKKKDLLIDALNVLIKSSEIFNLPILLTEQVPHKLGGTSSSLLLSSDITRIDKNSFSIFGSEGVQQYLSEQKVSHLILSGVETSICVYLSAIDAIKAGLEVTILSDCIGARRTEDESVVLAKLQNAGCHILPMESFLYGYMGTAAHPNFREISKLISNR